MENARQDPDDTRQKVRFCELQIYCWSRQFPGALPANLQ